MAKKGITAGSSQSCRCCQGSGWVVKTLEKVETVTPCPECHARETVARLLQRARIPPRYFDRGFDVFSVHHPLQERALRRSVEYVEAFPKVPRGLLFTGPCGVGKTHLSVAILKTLIQEQKIAARFIDETELLRRLQYSYGPDSPETEREVLLPLLNVELLVWDDLGTGRPTEWVAETIRTVINHRYTYNKQTILSTNWPLEPEAQQAELLGKRSEPTLAERIGHRLFSRIMEMCEIVEMNGPDARSEIHKAGLDFQNRTRDQKLILPAGLLHCPSCRSPKVTEMDRTRLRRSSKGQFVEIAASCQSCREQFIARFYPRSAQLEYPSRTSG